MAEKEKEHQRELEAAEADIDTEIEEHANQITQSGMEEHASQLKEAHKDLLLGVGCFTSWLCLYYMAPFSSLPTVWLMWRTEMEGWSTTNIPASVSSLFCIGRILYICTIDS